MLKHIGVPENELRDHLNYQLFSLLLSENRLSNKQLSNMTFTLINQDFLFNAIGEKDTDRIFIRSSSALWLAHLITVDHTQPFLTEDERLNVFQTCITYLSKEKA